MLESTDSNCKMILPSWERQREHDAVGHHKNNGQCLAIILSQHSYTNFSLSLGKMCIGGGSSTLYRLNVCDHHVCPPSELAEGKVMYPRGACSL